LASLILLIADWRILRGFFHTTDQGVGERFIEDELWPSVVVGSGDAFNGVGPE
jgi:hypothetical protein